jgi:hypothetical protein
MLLIHLCYVLIRLVCMLPLQVHWVFGSRLRNSSVTLANASLELMHEAPPAGACNRSACGVGCSA